MSHSIFDGLSVISLEGNALTVQQILESTLIQNTAVTVEDHSVTSTDSTVDPLNSNYASISVIGEGCAFHEDDVFQCGLCKSQFSSLETFMYHKRSQCSQQKVKQETSNEVDVGCDSESTLNQVTSSISNEEINPVDSSLEQNEKYGCSLTPSVPEAQSVVVSEGELFNLTLDGAQVFTLNNLHIPNSENGKIVENQREQSLFNSTPPLIPESEPQLTTQLACIVAERNDGEDNSLHKKGEDETLETPVEAVSDPQYSEENKPEAAKHDHAFFHSRMAKGPLDKETLKLKTKHRCTFCHKVFSKNFDLQQHIRSHTGEKPFQCIVCGRAFAQKSNVKKHMVTHKVWPKDSVCNTLPKDPIKRVFSIASSTNDNLDEKGIVKEEILVDNSYVCAFCSKAYSSYLQLRSHMKQHKDQKVYRCIQKNCEDTFADLDFFLEHIRVHEKELEFRCHTCSKTFNSLHSLGYHQFEHSIYPWPKKSGPSYFRCTICMNKYASAEALEHHLKMTKHHYPCKQCSRIFFSERLLRTHLRVHGNVSIACQTCCKEFKSEHSLKMHQLIHTGERPFECQICTLAFNRKDKLKRHMLVHEPKKFKCPFGESFGCQREFSRKDKIRLHLLSHTHGNHKKRFGRSKPEIREKSNLEDDVPKGENSEVLPKASNAKEKDEDQNKEKGENSINLNPSNGNDNATRVDCEDDSGTTPPISGSIHRGKGPKRNVEAEECGSKNCQPPSKIKVKRHSLPVKIVGGSDNINFNRETSPRIPTVHRGKDGKTPKKMASRNYRGLDNTKDNSSGEKISLKGVGNDFPSPRVPTTLMNEKCSSLSLTSNDSEVGLNDSSPVITIEENKSHPLPEDEFIISYPITEEDKVKNEEDLDIIYIPFSLEGNEFLEDKTLGTHDTCHMLPSTSSTSIVDESNEIASDSTLSLEGREPSNHGSFFVSNNEIQNLRDLSTEIMLSETSLEVIRSNVDEIEDIDDKSFFVVKAVEDSCEATIQNYSYKKKEDSLELPFESSKTIILHSKETSIDKLGNDPKS